MEDPQEFALDPSRQKGTIIEQIAFLRSFQGPDDDKPEQVVTKIKQICEEQNSTGWGDSNREQNLIKIGRILKEIIVRADTKDSTALLVSMSTYVGCTLDQPAEPQEEAKEDITAQEDKNLSDSISQVIMELYRQVIKFEKDRVEI